MAVADDSLFRSRPGHSPLHRAPAAIKLLVLAGLGLAAFRLGPVAASGLAIGAAAAGLACGVRLRELVHDLLPGLFYAVFLSAADAIAALCGSGWPFWPPRPSTLLLSVRLFAALAVSSVFFRTTSTLALREGLESAGRFVRRPFAPLLPGSRTANHVSISLALGLFLGFIPQIFDTRGKLVLAWRARGGRPGLRRLLTLFPLLLSASLRRADVTALALGARGKR